MQPLTWMAFDENEKDGGRREKEGWEKAKGLSNTIVNCDVRQVSWRSIAKKKRCTIAALKLPTPSTLWRER